MSRLVIRQAEELGEQVRWLVFRIDDEFSRYVASFPTLLDAENFVTRGEGHEEAS